MSSAYVVAIVVILVTAGAAVVVIATSVSRLTEYLGQFVESRIKPVFFPARHLDLLALQRRIVVVALTGVTVSVAGERYLAKRLRVQVSPKDYWRLSKNVDGGLDRVAADLAVEVGRRAVKLGYSVPAEMQVEISMSAFVVDGRPARTYAAPEIQPPPRAPTASEVKAAPQVKAAHRVKAAPQVTTPQRLPAGPELPGVAPATRLAAPPSPLSLRGTRLAATRRWNTDGGGDLEGDTTVNIDAASLVPAGGGPEIRLGGRRTTVGRKDPAHRCDVAIDHPTVSSSHAEVRCSRGIWTVVDTRSANGTYVNGTQVRSAELADGDGVQFSSDGPTFVFRLRALAGAGNGESATGRSM